MFLSNRIPTSVCDIWERIKVRSFYWRISWKYSEGYVNTSEIYLYIYRESAPLKDRQSTVLGCERFISTHNSTSKAVPVGRNVNRACFVYVMKYVAWFVFLYRYLTAAWVVLKHQQGPAEDSLRTELPLRYVYLMC